MRQYFYDVNGNLVRQGMGGLVQVARQPVARVAVLGETVAFSATVTESNGVSFQWQFNGADIPGATGDSLLIPNAGPGSEGQYSVVVTSAAGSVTSAPAALLLDSDGDGLPDSWENENFGNTTDQNALGDPDRDGATNLDEYLDGTDPRIAASMRPRLVAYSEAGGSVSVSPMKLSYEPGELVTLTATPLAGHAFLGWAGGLQLGELVGSTNPVTFRLRRNRTIRARFASAVPVPPGLIASWRGETDANDLFGQHHAAFFRGATPIEPHVTAYGKVGGALSFDGTVHMQVPDSSALRPALFTLEAWVFPTVLSGEHQAIIAHGSSTNENNTWYLGLLSGKVRFWSQGMAVLEGPTPIPLDEWTHVAATYDGAGQRLYVNGLEVAAQPSPAVLIYDPAPVPVTIGGDWASNGPASLFSGLIDEVAIYDRALAAHEIAEIANADFLGKRTEHPYFTSPARLGDAVVGAEYTAQLQTILGAAPITFSLSGGALPPGVTLAPSGAVSGTAGGTTGTYSFTVLATDAAGRSSEQSCVLPAFASVQAPAGLVGWWRAENDAQDASGSNHGALRNGAGFGPGKAGQAFVLDGVDGCVKIPDSPTLRPESVTLEAWVAFDAPGGLQFVFAKPLSGWGESYALGLQHNLLKGQTSSTELYYDFAPVPGRWYHLAYTFENANSRHVLYVDGAEVARKEQGTPIIYEAQPLLLGLNTESEGITRYFFRGRIDEASIYNRALSGGEIALLFNAGPSGKRL